MIVQQWLDLVCQMLPGVNRGILIRAQTDNSAGEPEALWPARDISYADLSSAAALAAERGAPVVSSQARVANGDCSSDLMTAFPLLIDGQQYGVIALDIDQGANHQQVINQLLEWGQAWLRLLLKPQPEQGRHGATLALKVISAGFQHEEIPRAASAIAAALKEEFASDRVFIGLLEKQKLKLQGVSDTTNFDPRVNLVGMVESMLQPVVDTGESRRLPDGAADTIPRDYDDWIAATGNQHLLAVPLRDEQNCIGAVLLERSKGSGFSRAEQLDCEELCEVLGAQFALKRAQQRPLISTLADATFAPVRKLVRPGHIKFKLIAAMLVGAALFLSLVNGDYRVTAPAELEGKIQRAIVAPFEGYVARAHTRAGELVSAGDVVAELEDNQLKLEQRRWQSQRDELNKEYRKALSQLDHAEARIVKAQVAQAQARLRLIEDQLQRAALVAPIDGVIISGDLSRSLGVPVERGQVLFEVSPLDEYRLVLEVSEHEIRDVRVGQEGSLSLTAVSGQRVPFVIERVSPVFQERDGKVGYRTEARLTESVPSLRPGMQGVGKILVEQRSYGWILFHRMIDWLKIRLWSWWP